MIHGLNSFFNCGGSKFVKYPYKNANDAVAQITAQTKNIQSYFGKMPENIKLNVKIADYFVKTTK